LIATRNAADSAAAAARVAATTASGRRFGLPWEADSSANAATSAAALTISRGISTVLALAAARSVPARTASTYSRNAVESRSMSSSPWRRRRSARTCISAASGHCLLESLATFCNRAAAVATTAAAAEPLAGAGASEAISVRR